MTWQELEEQFDDMINEYHEVQIMGLEYTASDVLRKVDPTAYRCGLLDYADACGVDTDELEGEMTV